jgi:flagellar biosynthetic protein FliQ
LNAIDLTILLKETVLLIFKCSLPLVGGALLIGIVISLLQALTQIQENTLTFLPKFIVLLVLLVLLAPWISDQIHTFFKDIFLKISQPVLFHS